MTEGRVDVEAWKAGVAIKCEDGVERTDTEEQAVIRRGHAQAVAWPERFGYHGLPYARGSRAKGSQNSITKQMKAAIVGAAEIIGRYRMSSNPTDAQVARQMHEENPDLSEALIAYFLELHKQEPRTFGALMGKLMPFQISGPDGGPINVQVNTIKDLIEFHKRFGIPVDQWLLELQEKLQRNGENAKLIDAIAVKPNAE